MKNSLPDWRIPLIFAVPVLLWAGLIYALLQPIKGVVNAKSSDTVTWASTPLPTLMATPYPTSGTVFCSDHSEASRLTVVAHSFVQADVHVVRWVVVDQNGKPVGCLRVDETITNAHGTFSHKWWTDADGSYRFIEEGTIREKAVFSDPTGLTVSAIWP